MPTQMRFADVRTAICSLAGGWLCWLVAELKKIAKRLVEIAERLMEAATKSNPAPSTNPGRDCGGRKVLIHTTIQRTKTRHRQLARSIPLTSRAGKRARPSTGENRCDSPTWLPPNGQHVQHWQKQERNHEPDGTTCPAAFSSRSLMPGILLPRMTTLNWYAAKLASWMTETEAQQQPNWKSWPRPNPLSEKTQ